MAAINLNHVSIPARNVEESARFYEELFGLTRIPTPNFGHPVQWLRIGDLQLHVFERPETPLRYAHFALTVDDFAGIYKKAKALGIFDSTTFGHHLVELPNGNVQLYIRDPAGNLIEVDWSSVATLPPEIAAERQRLADRLPQSEWNRQATLFLAEPVAR